MSIEIFKQESFKSWRGKLFKIPTNKLVACYAFLLTENNVAMHSLSLQFLQHLKKGGLFLFTYLDLIWLISWQDSI